MREIKTNTFRFYVAPIEIPGQDSPVKDNPNLFGCFAKLSGHYLNRSSPFLLQEYKTEADAEIALAHHAEKFLIVFKNNMLDFVAEAKDLIVKVATTPDQLTDYRISNPNEEFLVHKVCTTSIREAQRHLKDILDNTLLDQPDGWYSFFIGEVRVGDLNYKREQRFEYSLVGPDRLRLAETIWATDILQAQYPLKRMLDEKPNALEGTYLLYYREQLVTAHTYRRDESNG